MPAGSFTAGRTAISERARQKLEEGPVTGSYGSAPKKVSADEEEHAGALVDLLRP